MGLIQSLTHTSILPVRGWSFISDFIVQFVLENLACSPASQTFA